MKHTVLVIKMLISDLHKASLGTAVELHTWNVKYFLEITHPNYTRNGV
jgi:hypothetical protein